MFRATPPASARIAGAAAVLAAAAGAALTACRDVTAPAEDPATVQYAAALQIRLSDFRLDTSGVYVQDVALGSGAVIVPNASVNLNYTGNLANGRQFDSNANTAAATFVIGNNVRGFDRGLLGARAGGRRRLIIPPALAYGNQTRGTGIPAGSVLIFTVDIGTVTPPTPIPASAAPTPNTPAAP